MRLRLLESLLTDMRYAIRLFRAKPGFTAVAALSLALGIGANTAIFTLINAILLRELPVRDADRLVLLSDPAASGVAIGTSDGDRTLFTYQEFEQLRDRTTVFSGMLAAESSSSRVNMSIAGGAPEEARTRLVSGDYFRVLGVDALLGRTFTAADEAAPGSDPYIVLSHAFWQKRFGMDAGVLGRTVRIGKTQFTIVGVMPPEFFGEQVGTSVDAWLPMMMQPQVMPGRQWLHDDLSKVERVMWLRVMGRLEPGVTVQQAQANIDVVFSQVVKPQAIAAADAGAKRDLLNQKVKVRDGAKGASDLRSGFTEPLLVLMGMVALVLLIACANVANLLLARAASRRKEIGVRIAMGAGRGRLIRQVLTESVLLALIGGAIGILLAIWGTELLLHVVTSMSPTLRLDTRPDAVVLAFTAGISVLTGLLFGLAPALRTGGFQVAAALKEGSRSLTESGGRLTAGRLLVIGQVAISLVLLIVSGLFVRTLANLKTIDLGYHRDRLVLVRVDALGGGYKGPQIANVYRQLLDRFRAVPGVRAVTLSENGLFSGTESGDQISVEGYTPRKKGDDVARFDQVGPHYFSTLGIPILIGRGIGPEDTETSNKVCVINESLAKFYFGGRNPIGRHLTDEFPDARTTFEIVGVSRDAKDHELRGEVPRRFYVSLFQAFGGIVPAANFEIRTFADPESLLPAVRKIVSDYDTSLPILSARTLDDLLDRSVADDRLIAQLSAFFGLAALLLASVGLYGVLSHAIARRTSEIGIRMALGAEPRTVVAMVLRETAVLVALGAAAGIPLAIGAGRVVASRLFGLSALDPASIATATGILIAVALVAGYVPARRAAHVDPVIALRAE